MVDYIGVADVVRLIQAIGPGEFIERLIRTSASSN